MATGLQVWLDNENIKRKFASLLGKNTAAFLSSAMAIYNSNKALQNCSARSIVGALGMAAALNLPVTPSLGQAYIVPYNGQAQFQIGYKGLVQLAHRTGQYTRLHSGTVYEGEITGFHPLTGEPIIGERISDTLIGFVAYMQLVNGFEKYLYMTVGEMEAHARRYSKAYERDKRTGGSSSPWTTHFEAMATKTILKKLLSTWGVLSSEMSMAVQADQSVVDRTTFTYSDNGGSVANREEMYLPEEEQYVTDPETGEIIEYKEPVQTAPGEEEEQS